MHEQDASVKKVESVVSVEKSWIQLLLRRIKSSTNSLNLFASYSHLNTWLVFLITTVWEIGQSRRQLLVAFHQWCLKLLTINLTTVRFTGAFCIELSSLTNIRFLTNGGNFGETCSVLSTGPLSNVNFFLLLSVVTSFTRETPIVVLSVGCFWIQ